MNTSSTKTRRLIALLTPCAACALLVGGAAPTTAAIPPPEPPTDTPVRVATGDSDRLRLVATESEFGTVDLGESGDSIGDLVAWTDRLTAGGREAGTASTSCTRTSIERGESQCTGTLVLDGRGIVTLQVVLSDTGSYPLEVAVTGGTGEFSGVGGVMVVRPVIPGDDARLKLTLKLVR